MEKTLEQRKREIYSSMSKEDLVEQMLRRDGLDEEKSFQTIARENIPAEAVKAIQKAILDKVKDGTVIENLLIRETYRGSGIKEPSTYLIRMFESGIDKQFMENFINGVCDYLTKHYKEICEQVMYRAFLTGITKENPAIYEAITQVMNDREY